MILHYPEFAGAVLLTDDLAAGDLATKRGIEVWLSMTVLSQAYFDGHIDCPAAYAVLLDMRHVDRGVYVPGAKRVHPDTSLGPELGWQL